MNYIQKYNSPIGTLVIASDGNALIGLWTEGQKYYGSTLTKPYEEKDLEVFQETKQWLDTYFSGNIPDKLPFIDLHGTAFQKSVWNEILKIPYAMTISYKELADRVGVNSAQAVGTAVGHNPILILVPCHRVIGTDGSLHGYAAGLDQKQYLLNLESNS